MRIHSICLLAALCGCTWVSKADVDGRTPSLDDDGDGYSKDTDCDDDNRNVHPDAEETCDGVDNNCDGFVDEADAIDAATWYRDADSEGYGNASDSEIE